MPVKGIRISGRNTQGVRLVNLESSDLVQAVARVVPDEEADAAADGAANAIGADDGSELEEPDEPSEE
jgi:DNA gyrase subunit A